MHARSPLYGTLLDFTPHPMRSLDFLPHIRSFATKYSSLSVLKMNVRARMPTVPSSGNFTNPHVGHASDSRGMREGHAGYVRGTHRVHARDTRGTRV